MRRLIPLLAIFLSASSVAAEPDLQQWCANSLRLLGIVGSDYEKEALLERMRNAGCLGSPAPEQTSRPTDTEFHAAYCVGAIAEERILQSNDPNYKKVIEDDCKNTAAAASYKDFNSCLRGVSERFDNDDAQRQNRYSYYLRTVTQNAEQSKLAQLAAITEKGRNDARNSYGKGTEEQKQCLERCRPQVSAEDAFFSCVDKCERQYNPIRAGVTRCVTGPQDDLPF